MSIFKKKSLNFIILFLLSGMNSHAATFETTEEIVNEVESISKGNMFSFDGDFSEFTAKEEEQKEYIIDAKYNYRIVIGLIQAEKFKEANTKLSVLIEKDPRQSNYFILQAFLRLFNKDVLGAKKSFIEAVKYDPKNIQALIGLAKIAGDNQKWELAKGYAKKMLLANPYEVKAFQILQAIAIQQEGFSAAETILLNAYNKAKGRTKDEVTIIRLLSKINLRTKHPEKTLRLTEELLARNKFDVAVLSLYADSQLATHQDVGAEKTLRQIIAQQPDNPKYLFTLAALLGKQEGKDAEILNLLDKASINMPNPAIVLSYKVAILLKQGKIEKAYDIAVRIDDSNASKSIGKILKGDVNFAWKKFPDALVNYQQAYKITPNIKILDGILKVLAQLNKPKDAVILLEKELEKELDNLAIQFRLAMAYQEASQSSLSIKYYEVLLGKQNDNIIVLNNLATLYNEKNNPRALPLAKKAYQIAPKESAILDTYGYSLLKFGSKSESIKILKEAAVSFPDIIEIQLHLAEAYNANKDKVLAKEVLQDVISNKIFNSAGQEKAKKILIDL